MAGISIASNYIDMENGGTIGSSNNNPVIFNGKVNAAGTSNQVWGCRFENQILYGNSNISAGNTYTLYNSMSWDDYQFITILGGTKYTRGVVTFPGALYINWYDASHRLVISSDAEYLAVYFPNSTQVYIEGKSSALKEIKIYGIK